jgi:uncharacterized membrane protein
MQKTKDTPVKKIQSRNDSKARHRRDIALLSAMGIVDFIPISLYQLGIIKHIPDFSGRVFDSDYVNASKEAQIAGLPDGPVSLMMYAANMVAVGAALKKKERKNIFDYLIAANAIGQAAGGAFYLYNMIKVQKKVCIYCTAGALLNFVTLLPLKKLFFNGKDS